MYGIVNGISHDDVFMKELFSKMNVGYCEHYKFFDDGQKKRMQCRGIYIHVQDEEKPIVKHIHPVPSLEILCSSALVKTYMRKLCKIEDIIKEKTLKAWNIYYKVLQIRPSTEDSMHQTYLGRLFFQAISTNVFDSITQYKIDYMCMNVSELPHGKYVEYYLSGYYMCVERLFVREDLY